MNLPKRRTASLESVPSSCPRLEFMIDGTAQLIINRKVEVIRSATAVTGVNLYGKEQPTDRSCCASEGETRRQVDVLESHLRGQAE